MNRLSSLFTRMRIAGALLVVSLVVGMFAPMQHANAASVIFNGLYTNVFAGNVLVNSNSFKCTLHTSSLTPSKSAMVSRADLTNEVSGSGYTAGGSTCTVVGAVDNTNNRYDITVTGPSWPNATITARWVCVSKNSGTASTDWLIGCSDFGSDVTSTNSTFQVTFTSPFRVQN